MNSKRSAIALMMIAGGLATAVPAMAQTTSTNTTTTADSTAKCHAKMGKGKMAKSKKMMKKGDATTTTPKS